MVRDPDHGGKVLLFCALNEIREVEKLIVAFFCRFTLKGSDHVDQLYKSILLVFSKVLLPGRVF